MPIKYKAFKRNNWDKDIIKSFPHGSDSKESAFNVGDPGSILGQEDTLEESMAIHASILAWRIQGTEEPSELQ